MSIAICHHCPATIDTDEHEYSVTGDNHIICEDCAAIAHCENSFPYNGECICGEHTICGAERDVGIMQPYLELRT